MTAGEKQHCSALPRFFLCPSSAAQGEFRYNPESDVADVGIEVHKRLSAHVDGRDIPSTDNDEVERLVAYGIRAWKELAPHFPSPLTEIELESDLVLGRADILSADGEVLVVGDWKSGWLRAKCREQLTGYAHAAVAKYGMPRSGKVTCVPVLLRFQEYDVFDVGEAELAAFERDYSKRTERIGSEYNPGECCTYCPHRLTCGPRGDYLRSSAQALIPMAENAVTPARLAELYPQSRLLKKALEAYESALRTVLADGPLPSVDGMQLTLGDHARDVIDPRAAWPVLESEGFGEEDMARIVKIAKGAVEEVIGEKAPARMKGKRKAQVFNRLREAGAITEKHYQQIEVRKQPIGDGK